MLELLISLIPILLIITGLNFYEISRLRSENSNLKEEMENKEIEIAFANIKTDGIEDLLAQGFILKYSHSLGICAKQNDTADCIPLDEAILESAFSNKTFY